MYVLNWQHRERYLVHCQSGLSWSHSHVLECPHSTYNASKSLLQLRKKFFHRQFTDLTGFYATIHELGSIQPNGQKGVPVSCTRWESFTDQSEKEQRIIFGIFWLVRAGLLSSYGTKGSLGAGNLCWANKSLLVDQRLPFVGESSIETWSFRLLTWGLAWAPRA